MTISESHFYALIWQRFIAERRRGAAQLGGTIAADLHTGVLSGPDTAR